MNTETKQSIEISTDAASIALQKMRDVQKTMSVAAFSSDGDEQGYIHDTQSSIDRTVNELERIVSRLAYLRERG